jgi:hypothetical protein
MTRKIEWEPGIYQATKERASAIAWASNRRGSRVWIGKNVTNEITTYLQEHGYQTSHNKILGVMKKLADTNYAYIRHSDNKRSVKEFGFLPDMDLTGHSLPERKTVVLQEPQAHIYDATQPHPPTLPPIPAAPEPPLYRLDELEKQLKLWAEKDHETYAGWIDAAIESLRHNT